MTVELKYWLWALKDKAALIYIYLTDLIVGFGLFMGFIDNKKI